MTPPVHDWVVWSTRTPLVDGCGACGVERMRRPAGAYLYRRAPGEDWSPSMPPCEGPADTERS